MDGRSILVIDEDELTMQLLAREFDGQVQLLWVPSGQRAVALAKKNKITLAIIARCLPNKDGLEVLKKLHRVAPELPIIFVAAAPTKEIIIKAFRSGAKDFIEKPLEPEILCDRVKRLLEVNKPHPQLNDQKVKNGRPSNWHILAARGNSAGNPSWLMRLAQFLQWRFKSLGFDKPEKQPCTVIVNLPKMQVHFLGNFRTFLKTSEIQTWPSRKGRSIFAYLAFNHKRRIYRDILMDKFWPDSTPDSARNCLNVALHGLRQTFQVRDPLHEYILFKEECYYLNPEVEIWLDVEEFLLHWKVAQSIEREKNTQAALSEYELAAALYNADFMQEELYENWPTLDRENLKEIYLVILDRLSRHYSLDGKPDTAIHLCEHILFKDNCREDIHRRLMWCFYRLGQRDKAIKQFRKCTEILESELEVSPTQTTLKLYEQIKKDNVNAELF
ncbi:MAG: BTAD domain-containing putative transcriptional regulator [bacterium]